MRKFTTTIPVSRIISHLDQWLRINPRLHPSKDLDVIRTVSRTAFLTSNAQGQIWF